MGHGWGKGLGVVMVAWCIQWCYGFSLISCKRSWVLVTGGRALGGGQWVVAVVWWCQRVGVALGGGGGSDSLVLGGCLWGDAGAKQGVGGAGALELSSIAGLWGCWYPLMGMVGMGMVGMWVQWVVGGVGLQVVVGGQGQ